MQPSTGGVQIEETEIQIKALMRSSEMSRVKNL